MTSDNQKSPGQAELGISSDDSIQISDLSTAASDPSLNEDQVLALLKRNDIAAAVLEKIARNPASSKSRKIKLALMEHSRTPRHVALSLLRNLFTFDLMNVALMPTVAADIKIAAEESLIHRLDKLSIGEKLSLARRASARVVGVLVNEADTRIVTASLESPRLTEAMLVNSLMRHASSELMVQAVRLHPKWSIRPEIQQAVQRRAERLSQSKLSAENTAAESEG